MVQLQLWSQHRHQAEGGEGADTPSIFSSYDAEHIFNNWPLFMYKHGSESENVSNI
jgi:hypothetical protein